MHKQGQVPQLLSQLEKSAEAISEIEALKTKKITTVKNSEEQR
ncbi:707_t:CDS:2 [Gigaspora margarita]|uniref:707_t:CDS:1 n=1 Tax=Gigaspora margarita TaxID=4874 RepID=A0ABN7UAA1_GIGMA|nr:707_t:CDS:2 [Gigaspora margarita]